MSKAVAEAKFVVDDNAAALGVFGERDEHLRTIERELRVTIVPRGNTLAISGDPSAVDMALRVLHDLAEVSRQRPYLTTQEVRYALRLATHGNGTRLADIHRDVVVFSARGRPVTPRTLGQKRYVDAMRRHSLVFAIGPAGTGKTYLAVAVAIAALKERSVTRIVLTRPAVEAGERLGFLPGDLLEKVDPYLRPLYDALYDIVGAETYQRHVERGVIEVAPLAYMRGRTLEDAFIILDEAQNTTPEQMKMFLTRMGLRSRMVVTGDLTQIDLPPGQVSGLAHARTVLADTGIPFIELSDADVVRHELVQTIIRAYERDEQRRAQARLGLRAKAAGDDAHVQES
ncbi:MAG: PhoH family protein [Bacillota bacterium]|nr:phosphate starvation-inducible protein PhoH [Bacillota bacterium]REJ37186.1 MAG: phosphate starvation-inducible protein PhoH [Bacillota bacterium]